MLFGFCLDYLNWKDLEGNSALHLLTLPPISELTDGGVTIPQPIYSDSGGLSLYELMLTVAVSGVLVSTYTDRRALDDTLTSGPQNLFVS